MRAIANASRVILVGLMTLYGLVGATSQQPTSSELSATPDAHGARNPRFAYVVDDKTSSLPDNLPNSRAKSGLVENGNPLWSIARTSLTAARERPIFSPTRRAPPVLVKSGPERAASAGEPLLALVGVFAGENEGIAILLDGTTKRIIRLKTKESYAGWTLQAVKAREAILQNEQKTSILVIPNPSAK